VRFQPERLSPALLSEFRAILGRHLDQRRTGIRLGIRLDVRLARERLAASVKLAQSEQPLPQHWATRAQTVGDAPRKIDVAILATALIAKATDARVDALTLKLEAGERGYSARVIADSVLAPGVLEHRFDLRDPGPNPINGSTFLRPNRVDEIPRIRHRPSLEHLIESLHAVNELDEEQALLALAAFLRARFAVAAARQQRLFAPEGTLPLPAMIDGITRFVTADPEGGRRGQALVAALLDLVFRDVRVLKVNDPSRHWPGDVQVFDSSRTPLLSVEVRQKPVPPAEALRFAGSLRSADLHRGMVAALAPAQPPLPERLGQLAWERHQVLLTLHCSCSSLLLETLAWSSQPLDGCLRALPERMARRLAEQGVSEAGKQAWLTLFAPTGDDRASPAPRLFRGEGVA
jgi:hypothetical protein